MAFLRNFLKNRKINRLEEDVKSNPSPDVFIRLSLLYKEMGDVEHIRTLWGESWFKVKETLENMKKNFLSYDDYMGICKEENIADESSRETLVDFLNDLAGGPLTFGDAVRAVRELNEISQAELARRLQMGRQSVCDVEKGRSLVSVEKAARFARELEVVKAGLKLKVSVGDAA